MGPKTTPSLISKGGYQIPPLSVGGNRHPWEIGLMNLENCVNVMQIKYNFPIQVNLLNILIVIFNIVSQPAIIKGLHCLSIHEIYYMKGIKHIFGEYYSFNKKV